MASKQPITITRAELYERLWQTPIGELAKELGISTRRLTAICGQLKLTWPEQDYWTRKPSAAIPPLATGDPSIRNSVTITSAAASLDAGAKPVSYSAHSSDKRAGTNKGRSGHHPIVASWIAEHDDGIRRARLGMGGFFSGEFSRLDRRKHRLLSKIFRAAEAQGLRVVSEVPNRFHFEYLQQKIVCRLREAQKRVPPSAFRSYSSFELKPNGKLRFLIEHFFPSDTPIIREWSEKTCGPLEERVAEIAAALAQAGPALARRQREKEEAGRKAYEAERSRQREQALQKQEQQRILALIRLTRQYERAVLARRFLRALERGTPDLTVRVGDRAIADWLKWAHSQIDALDPLKRGAKLVFDAIDSGPGRAAKE